MNESLFMGARLKLDWASGHFNTLVAALDQFAQTRPYKFVVQHHPEIPSHHYKPYLTSAPPDSLALILGDVVHNLRSALDHVAFALVKRARVEPHSQLVFPIRSSRKKVIEQIDSGQLRLLGTDMCQLIIDDIEPYEGGNGADLYTLHKLDNLDKHRELIPTMQLSRVHGISVRDEHGFVTREITLTASSEKLMAAGYYHIGGELEIVDPGTAVLHLFFNSSDIAHGGEVLSTLDRLCQAVDIVIEKLERACAQYPPT